MWRRVCLLITIVVLGAGASGVAHGETTTTTAPSTAPATTTTTVPPSYLAATQGTRVQLEPLPTLPPTTAPPPTVNPGASTEVPANSGAGQRVIYAKRAQRVWLIN